MKAITITYYVKGHRVAESITTDNKVTFTMVHYLLDLIRDDVSVAVTTNNEFDATKMPAWQLKERIKDANTSTYDVSFEIDYVLDPEDHFATTQLSLDNAQVTIDGSVIVEAKDEEEAEDKAMNVVADETSVDDYEITITVVHKQ